VASVSPSGIDGLGKPKGRALGPEELRRVAELYARSATTARDIGFDAVELHGAHGYLLDQFFWKRTNLRADGYGGSLAARTRFPAEVIAAVRSAVGPDYPIIFRFSQWKGTDYAALIADDPTQLRELLMPLADAGVDMLHPSTRHHYMPGFPDYDRELSLAGWTKKVTGLPVITVGSVGLETQFRSEKRGQVILPAPVDRLAERQLPVRVREQGEVAAGYRAGTPQARPSVVDVQGPASQLDELSSVPVTVDVSGATASLTEALPVEVAQTGFSVNPGRVTVTVPVTEESPVKTVPVVVQISGAPAAGWQIGDITAEPDTVTVYGSPGRLAGISFVDTLPVSLTGYTHELLEEVPLQLPAGVDRVTPDKVTVTVQVHAAAQGNAQGNASASTSH